MTTNREPKRKPPAYVHGAAIAALALGAFLLAPPSPASGFDKNFGNLGLGFRDLRVFDNFADPLANDNTRMFPEFPGYLGVEQAIWKGAAEWNSVPRGGDPTQAEVGNGAANFDVSWQGNATGIGTTDDNIVSAISGCDGGTVAYCETPVTNGWRIRYCDNRTFADGPAQIAAGTFDLQSVQAHEYGHALGLAHSDVMGATMFSGGSGGTAEKRSIEADDIAGVQCIYGVASPDKPRITGVSVDRIASTVTITGTGFETAATNHVWFTRRDASATDIDPRVRILGVASQGGTSITVAIPSEAGPGTILVKHAGGQWSDLSNPYPCDLGEPLYGEVRVFNGGGSNPICFDSSLAPRLGQPWTAQIDASSHPGGADLSGFLLSSGSQSGSILHAGELLVHPGSSTLELVVGPSTGGLDAQVLDIPDDIDLFQRRVVAQGFTWSANTGLRLCNALELTLGARH